MLEKRKENIHDVCRLRLLLYDSYIRLLLWVSIEYRVSIKHICVNQRKIMKKYDRSTETYIYTIHSYPLVEFNTLNSIQKTNCKNNKFQLTTHWKSFFISLWLLMVITILFAFWSIFRFSAFSFQWEEKEKNRKKYCWQHLSMKFNKDFFPNRRHKMRFILFI